LRGVGNDDALGHRSRLHRQVDALSGVYGHVDALGDRRREALLLGAYAVIADPDVGELKIAVAVRLRSHAQPRVNVLQADGHAGHRRPARIADRAEHGGRVELRKGGVHGGNEQQAQERDQTGEFPPDGDSHVSSPYSDGFVDGLRPRLPNSDVMLRSRDDLQVVSL
jgi:prepilin-type processing-associated H-X9-DG protein